MKIIYSIEHMHNLKVKNISRRTHTSIPCFLLILQVENLLQKKFIEKMWPLWASMQTWTDFKKRKKHDQFIYN